MKKLEYIPFNIWDDFYDDGFAPEGEVQETFGYIEEYNVLTQKEIEQIIQFIFEEIKKFQMPDVKLECRDNKIYFTNLTHVQLDKLMAYLKQQKMYFNNLPIEFYSES